MVVAFYCIMEPEKRAELIQLAEAFAAKSQVVEGCTHFLLLEKGNDGSRVTDVPVDPIVPKRKPNVP
jgi:quinol monooxygenase YgiN